MSNSVQSVREISEFAKAEIARRPPLSQEIMNNMHVMLAITDSFFVKRREILQDFAVVAMTADAGKIAHTLV